MDKNRYLTSKVFSEIIKGYSEIKIGNTLAYIIHMSPLQESEIEEFKVDRYEEAIKKGLPTEKEKLEMLYREKLWSQQDDVDLSELRYFIENLQRTKQSLFFVSQIKQIEEEIKAKEYQYAEKIYLRTELLGLTAERYADKKTSNQYLFCSLYAEKDCSRRFFSKRKFDMLDEDEINDIIINFNKSLEILSDKNIKKSALSISIQNLYNLVESPFDFIGKPISSFTYYQLNFCHYASYYKSVLGELGQNITPEQREDPDKLDSMFISSQNIQREQNKSGNNGVTGLFGATEEDLKILGQSSEPDKLSKALEEKGEFSIFDAIKMGI